MARQRVQGFTLLEVLVAMTLMSVILVLLYGGMRMGARSWEASTQRAEIMSDLRLVQDFIRRQLRQSTTVFFNDPDDGRIVAFLGEEDQLRLVTPMLAYLGFGGLYWVHYDVVRDGEASALRIRWWPYQPDGEEEADDDLAGESVLLRGIDGLRFEYFGSEDPAEDPQWQDRWESPRLRPQLVRLSLDWARTDWPTLVVGLTSQ